VGYEYLPTIFQTPDETSVVLSDGGMPAW